MDLFFTQMANSPLGKIYDTRWLVYRYTVYVDIGTDDTAYRQTGGNDLHDCVCVCVCVCFQLKV